MPNFISEAQIESAIIDIFVNELNYNNINCFTQNPEDADFLKRKSKREVVLKDILSSKIKVFNPELSENKVREVVEVISDERYTMSRIFANKEVYGLIKEGVLINVNDSSGKEVPLWAKIIDFKNIENNEFTICSQMWIQGKTYFTRPDLIIFINGLPLVFIELKNSNVAVRNAFEDNLIRYREEIPSLFNFNQICILSNGTESRVGSYNADWEFFGEWLRVDDEKQKVDRKKIREDKLSLTYTVRGLCDKKNLLDYIENYILYYNDTSKIIAMNHQFLGVNNAIKNFEERYTRAGKLGVFWHTQGSGKSFSMVMFARKIFKRYTGNFTFLIITDREDLDDQIYKNFLFTACFNKNDNIRPKDSAELRDFLGTNRKYIFSMIHKFRYPKGKKYPVLSLRDDIIVIIDEAHRTQYKDLADNMRIGLPNAQFIAFTGTPLLGKEKKTNKWFGDYVSVYNFAQAVDDGATVPLFYDKRVPEVLIQNENLSDDFLDIIEDEEISEDNQRRIENEFASEIHIIKRDDRLETIAKDIAYHFPRRGYKGKGMVITIDKFTAVNMFDKVQKYWKEEMKNIHKEINECGDEIKKHDLVKTLQYMRVSEMAVVISEEAGEEDKFMKQGLDIKPHRKRMNEVDSNGQDIEDNFKDPVDALQLVFVCAMWLMGFDAKTVSTLYLDKPMKNHTLMQTIARANRVAPGKKNGLIIDYYNVFRNIKKALASYGDGEETDDKNKGDEEGNLVDSPIVDKSNLYDLLDLAIVECDKFCNSIDINLELIIGSNEVFGKLDYFEEFADKLLQKDEWKKQFIVYENTATSLYEACKPEIVSKKYERPKVAIIQYLRDIIDGKIKKDNIDKALKRISDLLDESVITDKITTQEDVANYQIAKSKVYDLSKIDFEKLRETFKEAKYKHIEISDLRLFIEEKLKQMLNRNITRTDFARRFQEIIDRYNSGGTLTENYFEDLMKFSEDLREEERRSAREGLTEEELEIFDLLQKDKQTISEKQKVKLAAKHLFERLTEGMPKVLTQDWHKDTQSKLKVENVIQEVLDKELPESYDRKVYSEKCKVILEHLCTMAAEGKVWAVA